MDESIQRRVEELFRRCVLLPPAERRRYLREQCSDPVVRREVEALLVERTSEGEIADRFDLRTHESDQLRPRAAAPELGEVESSTQPVSPVDLLDSAAADDCDVDIFICYAADDDQPTSDGGQGWVSRFRYDLQVRIEQISGERVKIRGSPAQEKRAEVDEQVLEDVPRAKTLISVVSPPFVESVGCRRQVEVFSDSALRAGNLRLESGARLFKVVKLPVPSEEGPPRLAELFSSLLDFDFYEIDPVTGRPREYDAAFGPTVGKYHERMYDLALEVCAVLRSVRARPGEEERLAAADGAVVYLATTTSDAEPERIRVRRELTARGHAVLPDRPLPLEEGELVAAVEDFLERCELAVHTVGGMYGVVPEGVDCSVLEVQDRIAAEHAARRGLARLIWIPRGTQIRDARQERWIETLHTEAARQKETEVIEDRFDGVKALLLRRLAEQAERARNPAREKPPRVYLICDRRDEEAIDEIEDFFFERGVEVSRPPFEASDGESPRIHIENLTYCDAALIYYGAADRCWVDSHLRDIAKASGYRDSGPIPVQVLYVAPPFEGGKERFEGLSVEILRQREEFEPSVLDRLAVRILEARTDA